MNDIKARAAAGQYEIPAVQSSYEWFVEQVISRIWGKPEWSQTAKGGEWNDPSRITWEKKYDVPYIGHILSGAQCTLKIFDIFIKNPALNPEFLDKIKMQVIKGPKDQNLHNEDDWYAQLDFRFRRALFGYLFHDYVKLTYDDYKMRDSKDNLASLVNKYFISNLEDLKLSIDDVYQIAYSTEEDTKFNALSSKVPVNPLLTFETCFSSLADKISSKFSEPLIINIEEWFKKLKFCDINLFKDYSVFKIPIASTYFVAVTDLLRIKTIEMIRSFDGQYLWNTPDAIYYFAKSEIKIDPKLISEKMAEFISDQLAEIAESIEFTDRRINIPGKQMFYVTKQVLEKVAKNPDKISQALRPENKQVPEQFIGALVKYRDVVELEFNGDIGIDLTPKGSKSIGYRDLIKMGDEVSNVEKMIKIILVRSVQLMGSQVKSKEFTKVREILDSLSKLEKDNPVLEALLHETKDINKWKSPLLVPVVVALVGQNGEEASKELGISEALRTIALNVDWSQLMDEVLDELSAETSDSTISENLSEIVKMILAPSYFDIPDVPDKKNMSMIDGYPGQEEAIKENLYGLGTNAVFTNRVITSTTPNSLVDRRYIIESFLRKKLSLGGDRDGSVFMYFDFPGPIPFLDLSKLLNYLISNQNSKNFLSNRLNQIVVSLNQRNALLRTDTSYFLAVDQAESTSDAIKLYDEALNLALSTNLRVQVIDSHAPPFLQQREIFSYAVNQFGLKDLNITRVRYNKLSEVRNFLDSIGYLANLSKSSSKDRYSQVSEIIRDFVREPLSLFSYCMDVIRNRERGGDNRKSESSSRMFPKDLMRNIEDYAERGFGGVKGGVNVENVKKLAVLARDLWEPKYDMSGSQRSWMLRDSLDVLEKAMSEMKNEKGNSENIENFLEFVEGHLYKGLQAEKDKPDSKYRVHVDKDKIKEFSRTFLKMISEDFNGRPPTGNMKSYLIDAFEFEYVFGD